MRSTTLRVPTRHGRAALVPGALLPGCAALRHTTGLPGTSTPGGDEIMAGLDQALAQAAGEAVTALTGDGGHVRDATVRSPFPQEAGRAADAKQVLFGGEHAATDSFRQKTQDALVVELRPETQGALDQVGAADHPAGIRTQYHRLPCTAKKIDTDLVHDAMSCALDGRFAALAAEEAKIRAAPMASAAVLHRIFADASRQS